MSAATGKTEMPTFSYAQAAKGLSTPPSSVKATSESVSGSEQPAVASTSEATAETQTSSHETSHEPEKPSDAVTDETDHAGTSDPQPTVAGAKPAVSGSSSPSVTSSLPKDDEISSTRNGSSVSTWDKQSQASVAERANGIAEEGKGNKSSASSEKGAPAPPKELKAAPIPTVNIWQQRKEAQEAKAKAMAASKPSPTGPRAASPKSAPTVAAETSSEPSKVAPKKKTTENAPEGGKDRKKSDAGKSRDEDVSIPSVGDAASWPTPQLAQGEEKKKPQEKVEKGSAARPHGKDKWMPVPYVPTAVFSTPLPSAPRRGARPTRGGREGAGRGGSHATAAAPAGDKPLSTQAASNATAKSQAPADRGRVEPATARANSLPAQARRSTSADAPSTSEPRRPSQTTERTRGDRVSKGTDEGHAPLSARPTNGVDASSRPHREYKTFPRNHEAAAHKSGDNTSRNGLPHSESHYGSRFGAKSFENMRPGDAYRDENGDGHKERDYARESRADRGRGSYRSRGGHATFGGSQNSQHFGNSHMSHHNFVPQKSFGYNDRQRAQQQQQQPLPQQPQQQPHGLPKGSQQGHRMSLRSPSLPSSTSMYGVYPYPADINTMYAYPPVQAAPMTAVPYHQYMEPFSLMSMISMQLEYYFSVDNLCKDLFLRKHMDTQGFVLLSFIASFKRIKTLTEDFELLRHVSRQLRNVEYHIGEDGVDRLRPRDKWEQWVLPIDQRDRSARNEGPQQENFPHHIMDTPIVPTHVEGMNGSAHDGPLPNGVSEPRVSPSPLSSTAPEFSPSNTSPADAAIANI